MTSGALVYEWISHMTLINIYLFMRFHNSK